MDDDASCAPRAKRQKIDKSGRLSALQKLKDLKGNRSKHKYEITDIENVYEEVDERDYSRRVLERQDDDWIVDDDGSGYVEDGREIFDDDLDDESVVCASKNKGRNFTHKQSRHVHKNSEQDSSENGRKSQNIRSMLMNMPVKKKKQAPVKLDEDDVLGDIMQELHTDTVIKPSEDIFRKRKIVPLSPPRLTTVTSNGFKPVESAEHHSKPKSLSYPVENDVAENDNDTQDFSKNDPETDKEESCSLLHNATDNMDMSNFNDDFFDTKMEFLEPVKSDLKLDFQKKSEVTHSTILNAIKDKPQVTEEKLLNGWATVVGSSSASVVDVKFDPAQLPLTQSESGDKVLRFYWLDAYEDVFKQPGVVFLFGKIWIESAKSYVSCCLTVKNIERRIYLLPREKHYNLKNKAATDVDVKLIDVYNEFNEKIATKYNIKEFRTRTVERNYAFDIADVPTTAEYLEVRYPATDPVLPLDLQGETFCHVFGTNTSSLEILLLSCKIKGPCWLEIKETQLVSNPLSWCKVEVSVSNIQHISVSTSPSLPPAPTLVVMTLNIRTAVHPKTCQSEVVMISCFVHYEFPINKPPPETPLEHFCAFTKLSDQAWPYDIRTFLSQYNVTKLEKHESERALLAFFLAKMFKIDPDVIVGHDLYGYELDILVHRMTVNKIPQWSRLGRLRRAVPPSSKAKHVLEKNATCGRLVCDTKISCKELIRARSYDLGTVCETVFASETIIRQEIPTEDVKKMYEASSSLQLLVSATMQDTSYIFKLMCELNVLPLALQITNIAGNVMSRTLMGGRSERNEFLLLHAFSEKNYIVPDKQYKKSSAKDDLLFSGEYDVEDSSKQKDRHTGRRKPAYTGGLVLDPKKGFYDKLILLMDFNSLYPSIIQEYNICFTTVPHAAVSVEGEEDNDIDVPLPPTDAELGILPTEIRKLVESRREVKKLMKDANLPSDLKLQYNIRQMALKLTANSMYGCLGFSFSRFYAKRLAALVTAKGREILVNTKDLVEKLNYDVIYGDTDSIMINTNCLDYDEVFKIGHKIKTEVNRKYRQVELDIDGVFKYMLLLKKKKYAAVTLSKQPDGTLMTKREMKGLDIVRRDWSQLAARAGEYILDQILSDVPPDERIEKIHSYLVKLREELEAGKISLSELTITKQLTKNPEDYADKKALPHVQVALRLNTKAGKKLKQGDTVAYVICEDGSTEAATQRAYHIDEVKSQNLKIDVKYYLAQQIHPVISRLCEPIDGTDSSRIADCLGLDPANYQHMYRSKEKENDEVESGDSSIKSEREKYKDCDGFTFTCMNESCRTEITVHGVCRIDESNQYLALENCINPECKLPPLNYLPAVQNALTLSVRNYVQRYYSNWLICEDPGCPNRTRRVPLFFSRSYPVCTHCRKGVMYKEYNESQLYNQLSYFQYMFDVSRQAERKNPRKISSEIEKAYSKLREHMESIIKWNAYSVVELGRLFYHLSTTNKKALQKCNEEETSTS